MKTVLSTGCPSTVTLKLTESPFDKRRKLKEHLVPAPHCGMEVICPFCITKEATFSLQADLKNHVLRRHKKATASINVPTDDLFSEDNCFWIYCWPAVYRSLVEPTDRNSKTSSKLRTLILDWTKKIMFTPKRSRQEWLEGWEVRLGIFVRYHLPSITKDPQDSSPFFLFPWSPTTYWLYSRKTVPKIG